ncbi:hypothetical protein NH26_05195 [Flammeovirga pacifica]|uniref:Uncharacterized protein n=2 Tax=Flammeovirga pacifica TaxID=915059 RepID=A0A1S1YXQ3_FLAPC|nr:hypothetical protein NH26_05195 [Flammeovirga pacifica]
MNFVNQVSSALNKLMEGEVGKSLVLSLSSNTTRGVSLMKSKSNQASPEGNMVGWNPDNMNGGIDVFNNTLRDPFIGLGHELAHIQDTWDKTRDDSIWFSYINDKGRLDTVPNNEKYATYYENMIRNEHNIPLRASYGIGPNEMWDRNSMIINYITDESLFYPETNNPIINRLKINNE